MAEEVVGGGVALALAEQAEHGLAGRAGRIDRPAVLAQARIPLDALGLCDGVEVAATLIHHEAHTREWREPAAEARLRTPDSLHDRSDLAVGAGVHVNDAVGFAQAH